MQRGIGRLRTRASGFNPASVFAGSAAGLWLDPSDISTGFTDSVGFTQQTASGQSTGFRGDKRLGSIFGAEALTNATFDSATGWTLSANGDSAPTISGGVLTITRVTGNPNAVQSFATVINAKYRLIIVNSGASPSVVRAGTAPFGAESGENVTAGGATTPVTFTATATTTYITAFAQSLSTTAVLDSISVKPWNGNHLIQATASTRPEYDVISSISSDFFDGSDDGYSTQTFTAGTLINGMDLFCAIKRSSTSNMVLASNGVANASFIGKMIAADGTSCVASVGTAWSVFVDGVQVGSTNSVTCGQLNTALGSGAYHVLEVRDLDLSAWTQFTLGSYTSFILGADTGGEILAPAQSTANRAALRKWLGAKVGLSL